MVAGVVAGDGKGRWLGKGPVPIMQSRKLSVFFSYTEYPAYMPVDPIFL